MTVAFHPYADVFNLIRGSDLDELVADVRKHGLRERIVVFDGKVLDGRNRYLAAIASGLITDDDSPDDRPAFFQRFVPAVDGDPLSYVISKNIHRRHLTIGQRAYAMAEFETLRHGGARKVQDANLQLEPDDEAEAKTRADLAGQGRVSERSIASAALVRDHGISELKDAVKQGDLAISAAEKIARLPEAAQREEVAHLPNGARAIMSSRQEPDDSLDYFPTPPWATRALLDHVLPQLGVRKLGSAWEPACGEGHIAEVLHEYFDDVMISDIHDYGYGTDLEKRETADFLTYEGHCVSDWIITNPPFGDKAEAFVLNALNLAKVGVAMFFRLQWLETLGRYQQIFKPHPPAIVAQFVERVPLHKGRWEPEGDTATAYLWIVWMPHRVPKEPTRLFWIPPGCREALTRKDDVARFTAHPVQRRESAAQVIATADPQSPVHPETNLNPQHEIEELPA